MARLTVTSRDWLAFEDWACGALDVFEFRVKFMTAEEKAEVFERQNAREPRLVVNDNGELVNHDAASANEPEPDEAELKQLLDEIEAEDKQEKEELLAFAEKLGCSIYLAAYLRHLNAKLGIIADAFGKTAQELPKKTKRRK